MAATNKKDSELPASRPTVRARAMKVDPVSAFFLESFLYWEEEEEEEGNETGWEGG